MITVSGVITLAILLAILLKCRDAKGFFVAAMTMLFIMTTNSITATAFYVGQQEINCDDLVLLSCSIAALLFLAKGLRMPKEFVRIALLLMVAIMAGIGTCIAFGSKVYTITAGQSWDSYYFGQAAMSHVTLNIRSALIVLRLMLFCILLPVTLAMFEKKTYIDAAHAVMAFSLIHVCFGMFEYVTKTFFGSTIALVISQSIFASYDSTVTTLAIRGDLAMLQGFTREGSHFAYAMFYPALVTILLYGRGEVRRWELACGVLAVLLMLLSAAFTSVICFATLLLFLLMAVSRRSRAGKQRRVIDARILLAVIAEFFVLAAAVAVAYSSNTYYVQKLTGAIANIPDLLAGHYGLTYGSADAMPRLLSMIESLRVFMAFPVFGIGIGTINPFSAVTGLLSTIGLGGLLLWVALVSSFVNEASGRGAARYFLLLFFALGLLSLDTGAMYSPVWLFLGGLFWTPIQDDQPVPQKQKKDESPRFSSNAIGQAAVRLPVNQASGDESDRGGLMQ